ncbi:hypothetical protein GQR58_012111 [Nymphon striatum]|nr:hypothetical protein GQR58_012111 [Nymphon striatum]
MQCKLLKKKVVYLHIASLKLNERVGGGGATYYIAPPPPIILDMSQNRYNIDNGAFDNNEKERGRGSDVRDNHGGTEIPTYSSIFHIPCDNSPPPPYQSTNPYSGALPALNKQSPSHPQVSSIHRQKKKQNAFDLTCLQNRLQICSSLQDAQSTDPRSTAAKKQESGARTIMIVLSLALLLFVAVIAVVLYLTVGGGLEQSEEYEETRVGEGQISFNKPIQIAASRVVSGMFKIKHLQFNENLHNKSSQEFFYLAKDVTLALDRLFKSSFLSYDYNGSEIVSLRQGSIVVDCRIYLNRPYMKVAVKVGMAFINGLNNFAGQMLLDSRFDIDVQSIMFTATSAPKLDNNNQEHGRNMADDLYPQPGWSQWSAWSSCINYISYGSRPRCDSTLKRNRVRVCRQNDGTGQLMKDDDLCESLPPGTRSFPMQEKQCECKEEINHEQSPSKHYFKQASNYTEPKRKCSECIQREEVCISIGGEAMASCRRIIDPEDLTGCGGLCTNHSLCRPLVATTAYQCIPDQPRCAQDEFQCKNNGSICIKQSHVCNGKVDCLPDASDEQNCPNEEPPQMQQLLLRKSSFQKNNCSSLIIIIVLP